MCPSNQFAADNPRREQQPRCRPTIAGVNIEPVRANLEGWGWHHVSVCSWVKSLRPFWMRFLQTSVPFRKRPQEHHPPRSAGQCGSTERGLDLEVNRTQTIISLGNTGISIGADPRAAGCDPNLDSQKAMLSPQELGITSSTNGSHPSIKIGCISRRTPFFYLSPRGQHSTCKTLCRANL